MVTKEGEGQKSKEEKESILELITVTAVKHSCAEGKRENGVIAILLGLWEHLLRLSLLKDKPMPLPFCKKSALSLHC